MMDTQSSSNDVMQTALDRAWSNDEGDFMEMECGAQGAPENQRSTQPGNPPTAPDRETDPEREHAGQNQPAAAPENQPELFSIRFNGRTEQVTRDELMTLAQKGRNYDHVQQELESLRQYRTQADPALELVKGYAQRNGMQVNEYLDWCRKQELMAGGMTEAAAAEKLGMEKERAALDAQQAEIQAFRAQQASAAQQAQQAAQTRQRDIETFYRAYPGVDPKTIPGEVWDAVRGGDSLTNAYTMHENRRLSAELAAERQNRANQAKAPGSLGGNAAKEMDEIDRLWNEEE